MSQVGVVGSLVIAYFVVAGLLAMGTWLLLRRRSAMFRWRWKAWIALLNNVAVGVFLVALLGLMSRSWGMTVGSAVFMALVTYYHAVQSRVCHRCGKSFSPGNAYCSRCGARLWASPFLSVRTAAEPPISDSEEVGRTEQGESSNKEFDRR